eukprot:6770102-Alexandrium_andersonii.AAC.1
MGPRKRNYRRPSTARPTAAQWEQHLGQEGPLGGFSGVPIEWQQWRQQRDPSPPPLLEVGGVVPPLAVAPPSLPDMQEIQ